MRTSLTIVQDLYTRTITSVLSTTNIHRIMSVE